MKPWVPYILLVCCTPPLWAQEARLSYLLEEDSSYLLHVDLEQHTYSESVRGDEIALSGKTGLRFRVDSLTPSGRYDMSVSYTGLQLSMLAPGMDIDINSARGKNPALTQMIRTLEDRDFRVTMDRSGQLISLEGLAGIFAALVPAGEDSSARSIIRSTLHEVYGPDAFRSLFHLFVSVYPPVQPLRNWTSDFTIHLNRKPVDLTNRFVLARHTGEELFIQGIGMLESEKEFRETTSLGEVASAVSGSQTYDFRMDRDTGWLRECVSRQRIVVETTVLNSSHLPEGLKIPSFTETVFEITGTFVPQTTP